MKICGLTILITGGSAGMGLAFARLLSEKGNNVIITGRIASKLKTAVKSLHFGSYYVCDVTKADEVDAVYKQIAKEYGGLHMLINNAGRGFIYRLGSNSGSDNYTNADAEIETNYLSVIRLVDRFLPLLSKMFDAAIVNVSSVAAIVPDHNIPTYSASKAALHSYTQLLRYELTRSTRIKVFELMPPLVETEFSKGLGSAKALLPEFVAEELLNALENDIYEIRVGSTENIYRFYLRDPDAAFAKRNP